MLYDMQFINKLLGEHFQIKPYISAQYAMLTVAESIIAVLQSTERSSAILLIQDAFYSVMHNFNFLYQYASCFSSIIL